jgi:hypothetical protein
VEWWFDFAVTSVSKDRRTVRTDFRRGPRPTGKETPEAARKLWAEGSSLGTIHVTYPSRDARKPTAVKLELAEGISPSALARFAWQHWLTNADEVHRSGPPPVPSAKLSHAIKAAAGRPGRGGHHPEFFENVARRYRDLRLGGDRAPVTTIAVEAGVPRNTAAGWVKRARERGLLPPSGRSP